MRLLIYAVIIIILTGTVVYAVKPKIFLDNDNKQYALKQEDCKYANFSTLNAVIKPLGFKAGTGGGYVKQDKKFYCNPCIVRINKTFTIDGNLFQVYKPVEPYVNQFARGVSYEWCEIIE